MLTGAIICSDHEGVAGRTSKLPPPSTRSPTCKVKLLDAQGRASSAVRAQANASRRPSLGRHIRVPFDDAHLVEFCSSCFFASTLALLTRVEFFASRRFGHSQPRGQIWYRRDQHLLDPLGEDELHLGAHILGQIAQVLLIFFWQDGAADAGAARG